MINFNFNIYYSHSFFVNSYTENSKRNDQLYYAFRDYLLLTKLDSNRYKVNVKFENFGNKIIIWIEDK